MNCIDSPSSPGAPSSPVILKGSVHSPNCCPNASNVTFDCQMCFPKFSFGSTDQYLSSEDSIVTSLVSGFHVPLFGAIIIESGSSSLVYACTVRPPFPSSPSFAYFDQILGSEYSPHICKSPEYVCLRVETQQY